MIFSSEGVLQVHLYGISRIYSFSATLIYMTMLYCVLNTLYSPASVDKIAACSPWSEGEILYCMDLRWMMMHFLNIPRLLSMSKSFYWFLICVFIGFCNGLLNTKPNNNVTWSVGTSYRQDFIPDNTCDSWMVLGPTS